MKFLLAWLILSLGVLAAGSCCRVWRCRTLGCGGRGGDLRRAEFLSRLVVFDAIGVVTLGIGFLLAFVTRLIVNAFMLKFTDGLTPRINIIGFGNAVLARWLLALSA